MGVAAVDDHVVPVKVRVEVVEGRVHRVARGDHEPYSLVVAESVDEVGDAVRGFGTRVGGRRDGFRREVEGHDLVPGIEHSVDYDASHPAEADDA